MANGLYPTDEEYAEYWTGQARRSKARANKAIDPIFSEARDIIAGNILDVLNDRRYLKTQDIRKRLRKVKADDRMEKVEKIIIQAGERSLAALYANQPPHYEEEVPHICKDLYPWTTQLGGCKASPLTKKEINDMRTRPYLGRTWKSWIIEINTKEAVTQWNSQFRKVMTGDIRTATQISREAQLVTSARKILTTQQNKNKTNFENAMIETSRKAQFDTEAAIWG